MFLFRINKGVYLCLFEHANTRKHVYEHSCSSVRVFWRILAHLAHLAHLAYLAHLAHLAHLSRMHATKNPFVLEIVLTKVNLTL